MNIKIGLCLSGGGVRAALYHLGILKALAEKELLQNIAGISSVSGGSLLTGLIFHFNDMRFPTNKEFIENVYPKILKLLTTQNLQLYYLLRLFLPWNILKITSAANILSSTIFSSKLGWGIQSNFKKINPYPVWSVNGTTYETGKRYRFSTQNDYTMGDYKLGYANVDEIKLSDVMAISAAFPGGIGPFKLNTNEYQWHDYFTKNTIKLNFETLHIMDGGVYDNLGLEQFFDISNNSIKEQWIEKVNFLIVSDASVAVSLEKRTIWKVFKRAARLIDIIYDQVRSVRVRSFVGYLKSGQSCGLYLSISQDMTDIIRGAETAGVKYKPIPDEELNKSKNMAKIASSYPTTLKCCNLKDAESIIQHGYSSLNLQITLYM